MRVQWVEGATVARDFALTKYDPNTDTDIPLDLTGMTVALALRDRTDAVVSTTGWATVVDPPTGGKVRVEPGALTAALSPYIAHFMVTDGDEKTAPFPEGPGDLWVVNRS